MYAWTDPKGGFDRTPPGYGPAPRTFRALGWNVGQGTLVRFLCHSHRGPKSAYGGVTDFIQDEGVFKGGPGRPLSHICPSPYASFQLTSGPDSASQNLLFIELGRVLAKRVWLAAMGFNVMSMTLYVTGSNYGAMNIINSIPRRAPEIQGRLITYLGNGKSYGAGTKTKM